MKVLEEKKKKPQGRYSQGLYAYKSILVVPGDKLTCKMSEKIDSKYKIEFDMLDSHL